MNITIWQMIIGMIFLVFAGTVSAQTQPDEGFSEPLKTVRIAAPESGVIQSIVVAEGDFVQRGDVLCKLDCQVLEASLNAAKVKLGSQGKIKAAQATLEEKQYHLKQMQNLFVGQHASDKEVRQAQLEVDLANAHLQSANDESRGIEMDIKKIEAQIERRIIRSSTDGVVLQLPRQEGEAITTSESEVATIVRLDQLRIRYFLTTIQAMGMKRGDQTKVYFPATNQTALAKVDFVAPVTDSNSGTVRVELIIDNQQGQYRSGLRCVLTETRAAFGTSPVAASPVSTPRTQKFALPNHFQNDVPSIQNEK
jgi:RND family efflux transporter MFP subunit